VDAIADTVDGSTAATVVRKLKPGGVLASVLGPPSKTDRRDIVIKAMQVTPDPATLMRMACAVQDGTFSIPIGESFPLKNANAAHAAAEGGRSGKILLLA